MLVLLFKKPNPDICVDDDTIPALKAAMDVLLFKNPNPDIWPAPLIAPSKVPTNVSAWLLLTNKSFQYFVGEPKSDSPSLPGKIEPVVSRPNNIFEVEAEA